MEDIPKALRQKYQPQKSPFISPLVLVGGAFVVTLGVISLSLAFWLRPQVQSSDVTQDQPTPEETTVTATTTITPAPPDNLLGHLSYEEAPTEDLMAITPDQKIKLRSAAAEKFLQMQADAQAQGIILFPISAFRSTSDQENIFFNVKEERAEVTTQRAEVSAPPGYSEHHTGYALDIGDGSVPATHLQLSFADTPAFRWLQANAARYSFEISFAENNSQGISYEPWHWRYVGNSDSLETFYRARNLIE
jgi:D-alanyl-D-alanine carboxypeptidase